MRKHEHILGQKDDYRSVTLIVNTEHWDILKDYVAFTRTSASEVLRILLFRWLRDRKLTKKDSFWNNYEAFDVDEELSLENRIEQEREFIRNNEPKS